MSTKQASPKNSRRTTIGVIIDSLSAGYQTKFWRELRKAAIQYDVNLLCFVGSELNTQPGVQKQANTIYKLANAQNLDGLILLTGTISQLVTPEYIETFVEQFRTLPLVSVAAEIKNTPAILLDNRQGILDIMAHLVETHHCQRIAFIRMPEGHNEGDQRFQAYREALETYGLPFDPSLVVEGEFYGQGKAVVDLLYNKRKLTPDAIVAVDDDSAITVMEALRARGISIPKDVILTGFDDIEISRYTTPPLTTIRQPLDKQARQAIETILAALQGQTAPHQIKMKPELAIRESCGCYQTDTMQPAASDTPLNTKGKNLDQVRAKITNQMASKSQIANTTLLKAFLDTFLRTIETGQNQQFAREFSEILQQTTEQEEDTSKWQSAISVLRHYVQSISQDQPEREIAEGLIQQARILAAEAAQRAQAQYLLDIRKQQLTLRYLNQEISLVTHQDDLFKALRRSLPNLGIPEFTISLYPDQNPAADSYILAAALAKKPAPFPLPHTYPAETLLPEGFLPAKQRFARVVEPLHYFDKQFGFVTFESKALDETIYDSLAEQISSGIQSVALVQQIEHRNIQLQTASDVARAANSILNLEELIPTIVNLIRDRFNLYYVGLFLVDRNHRFAVLRAGTGPAGEKMLAENWQLEIGGKSMIGRCLDTRKPDIQPDVDKAAVHFRNPHLPNTKSELALPLISRGETLGALTIQSTITNAFNEEDIAVLQTMAEQIAVSIANARLFEQTQNALTETETLLNVAQLASSATEIDLALPKILDLVLDATQIDAGLFSIFNPENGKLELRAAKLPAPLQNALQTNGMEGSLCELVYKQKKPLIVYDLAISSPIDSAGLIALGFRAYQGIPIENKGNVFGTFCTFSKQKLLPENTSIHLLRSVGQQVGFAIENSRLFQQTQKALAELEAAQRRYQIQAWSNYNRQRRVGGYRRTPEGLQPLKRRPLPEVQNALQKRTPIITEETLTVPIMLRDQPIGAIGIQYEKNNRHWTSEEIALIQNIGEQFALAAETLRLLDATQRQAARERLVAEITTKLRATNDPQAILQTVTQELRTALNARRAQVLMQPAESSPASQNEPDPPNQRGET